MLATGSSTLGTGLLIWTLIQEQHPTHAQLRRRGNLPLDLLHHRLRRPGRVGHELLHVLPIIVRVGHPTRDVGKVAFRFRAQQALQIRPGVFTGVPCPGFEAMTKACPEVQQTVAQVGYRLVRQAPPARFKRIRNNYLVHHDHHHSRPFVARHAGQDGTQNLRPSPIEHLSNLTLSRYLRFAFVANEVIFSQRSAQINSMVIFCTLSLSWLALYGKAVHIAVGWPVAQPLPHES